MHGSLTPFADRLVPARADLAAAHLRGRVTAAAFVAGEPRRVTAPLLDLTASPDPAAERATQLIHGETFTVYEERDGLAWGQAALDGYVGYVEARHLGRVAGAGRRVTALWSHLYARPLARSAVEHELPFLAEVPVSGTSGSFARLRGGGFVPFAHLLPVADDDFVAQAERFLGVPYLWGGRSARGIDCSGLVQVALVATGRQAPRDSDMQASLLGEEIAAKAPLRRGDLVFWKGHVGMMRDRETLLHANAHHMAVAAEPLAAVAARVTATGGGAITARRRLTGY